VKLYYSDVLSPRKACAVARYLGSPVEFVYLDLVKGEQQAPAYLALNPNGKVPTLVDGDKSIWEADAVICHLAVRAGSDLWPHDTVRQTEVVRWLSWNAQHFYRQGGSLYFQHIIKARFALGIPEATAVNEALAGFRRFAAVLDAHLAGRRWLIGDTPSVADFSVGVGVALRGRGAHTPPRVSRGAALARSSPRIRGLARALPKNPSGGRVIGAANPGYQVPGRVSERCE
jgi:glutathione S-transferase